MTIIRKPDPNRIIAPKTTIIRPDRTNFIQGSIGVNKTGKSSDAREIVEYWRSTRIPNLHSDVEYMVVGYDPQNVFGDLIDLKLELDDPEWALRCCEFKNCLIVLDEIKDLLEATSGRSPKGLLRLFSQSFFNNVDIMWMVHNPLLAPNAATSYTTHYFIYLTFAKEGSFKRTIPNYSLVSVASSEVNEYVRKYGRGRHKLDPEYDGQGFPHIIVNTEKQTLQAINMNKEISSKVREYMPLNK